MAIAQPQPTISGTIDQTFLIEPLQGPGHYSTYLDRFPDSVYNKSVDSHLVKFLYTLIGPAGISQLRQQAFQARLILEEGGVELFDLEAFYSSPFRFGRIVDELYPQDPTGLLDQSVWDQIRAADEAYRSRAIDFFNAVRLGTSPEGMRLAARSGLGHDVEVVENYKYLYDSHSDDPKGYRYYGSTSQTEEFAVVPRREVSRSEIQTITFSGIPTAGNFILVYNGRGTGNYTYKGTLYSAIPYTADFFHVQAALESIPEIGTGNVQVTGGPAPFDFLVTFQHFLSAQNVPTLQTVTSLQDTNGLPVTIGIDVSQGGKEATDEVVTIAPAGLHHMESALDRLRPVNSIPTLYDGAGLRSRQAWQSMYATSEYTEVVRYVVGRTTVTWPKVDGIHWIEPGVEKPGPRPKDHRKHHHQGFHKPHKIHPHTERALDDPDYDDDFDTLDKYKSVKVGRFHPAQVKRFPLFKTYLSDLTVLGVDRVEANYPEPLVTTSVESGVPIINNVYPADYASLTGVDGLDATVANRFWSSLERDSGDEYLEIDLGDTKVVNYLTFEITAKPIDIEISYDSVDQQPRRTWEPVVPTPFISYETQVFPAPEANPWVTKEYSFEDTNGDLLYTRFLRVKFARRIDGSFLVDANKNQLPWTVDVRNLRIGRNVAGN